VPLRQRPRVLEHEQVQKKIGREADEADLPQKVRDLSLPDLIALEIMRVFALEAREERRRYVAGPEAEADCDRIAGDRIHGERDAVEAADRALFRGIGARVEVFANVLLAEERAERLGALAILDEVDRKSDV